MIRVGFWMISAAGLLATLISCLVFLKFLAILLIRLSLCARWRASISNKSIGLDFFNWLRVLLNGITLVVMVGLIACGLGIVPSNLLVSFGNFFSVSNYFGCVSCS